MEGGFVMRAIRTCFGGPNDGPELHEIAKSAEPRYGNVAAASKDPRIGQLALVEEIKMAVDPDGLDPQSA